MAEPAGSGAWTTRCCARTSPRCTRSSACGWRTRASCSSRPPTSSSSSWPRSSASRAGWSTTARSTSSPGPPGTRTPSTASCASTGRCGCARRPRAGCCRSPWCRAGARSASSGWARRAGPASGWCDTRAWIARSDQGHGLGRRCRAMLLELAFAHLGAARAVTAASKDNAASRAVSKRLGYRETEEIRGADGVLEVHASLTPAAWRRRRLSDVDVDGVEPFLAALEG